MTKTYMQITEDDFDATYTLLPNHLDTNASWSNGDGPGCLFETFGKEHQFVLSQDPATIWTLIDGDEDFALLLSGYHRVNRLGYLISTTPVPKGVEIEVRIPSEPGE